MRPIVVVCDRAGEPTETFIATEVEALRRLGRDVRVMALADLWTARAGVRAAARLAMAHPIGCLRDLLARRRWRREEDVPPLRVIAPLAVEGAHLHAHFATAPALAAMRVARITGAPWSFTGHGYDLYQRPANLAEKARAATFAVATCEYTARHLRQFGGRVEVIVMGVDLEAFRRTQPPPGGRTVLAIGRLVEKKGFRDLAEAARALPDVRVVIAGDGPLRDELDGVDLLGPVPHDRVRELLESADLLVMPCVVAADGDRDSQPVVVKEALAMEVPVVATDAVGLPEVVWPEWGTLVAPHDPSALAAAIRAELDRPPAERAMRGSAGRDFVSRHADARDQAERLAAMIEGPTRASAPIGPKPAAPARAAAGPSPSPTAPPLPPR
jgi:glycosyltransferase involved in cell wall biosynthesis